MHNENSVVPKPEVSLPPAGVAFPSKDVLFLSKVTYVEERKEVLVEFSNNTKKILERFKFFPFLALPKGTDAQKVSQLLLSTGIRGFSISEKTNYLALNASSFSGLKVIATTLGRLLGKLPLVIAPERQFLLEKSWTYFDSFMQYSASLVKVDSVKKDVSFAVVPEIPFSEVMRLDRDQGVFLAEQAALSSLLAVPLHAIPKNAQDREELFLQNMFFKNAGFISWEPNEKVALTKNKFPFVFDKVSSVDFSGVWVQLFSKQFFNVGPDTKNCACCKPFSLEDANLLPSSLIEMVFNETDFFFESSSPTFAEQFDTLYAGKEVRDKKKKEHFLSSSPVGPISVGSFVKVPLLDAKRLLEEGVATLGKNHAPEWFCKEHESFFSEEITKLASTLSTLSLVQDDTQSTVFGSNDFGVLFAKSSFENLARLIAELPFQLMNQNSAFFSPSLAKTIVSIQEATLFRFREFSKENGFRVLYSDKRSALIRGHSPLLLARKFSESLSLPRPEVASFSQRSRF